MARAIPSGWRNPCRAWRCTSRLPPSHDPRYSALVAVTSLEDATAAARRAALWLGLAMLTAAALLAALLLSLVRNITRPLSELSALADRIATGERSPPLDLPRSDEIGALAQALNSMMTRLAGYESRLASRSRLAALGDMSARLAHEIRNPLTGIKLHLQLLAERAPPREVPRVQQLLGEVQRLELLVSSTLMLGAEQPLESAPVDLAELVADVLDLMQPSLEHRGIVVERCARGMPPVPADRARLRQALLNLIVNAADAMPRGGRLRVGTETDDAAAARADRGRGFGSGRERRAARAPADRLGQHQAVRPGARPRRVPRRRSRARRRAASSSAASRSVAHASSSRYRSRPLPRCRTGTP